MCTLELLWTALCVNLDVRALLYYKIQYGCTCRIKNMPCFMLHDPHKKERALINTCLPDCQTCTLPFENAASASSPWGEPSPCLHAS